MIAAGQIFGAQPGLHARLPKLICKLCGKGLLRPDVEADHDIDPEHWRRR
jgi:hypothetical protein